MPVRLRTEPGYYARIVEIEGSKFFIADLGDHYDEFVDRYAALREHSGITEATRAGLLDPAKLVALMQEVSLDPARQKELYHESMDLIDWMLEVCLVRWDLAAECDGATKRALPAGVKSELARAILAASELSFGEATFPGGLGAGDAGRG